MDTLTNIVSNSARGKQRGRKPKKKTSILLGNAERLNTAIAEALSRGDLTTAKSYSVLLKVALKLAARDQADRQVA